MSSKRPFERMFALMLAVLLTAGCGGRQAEPSVRSTPTHRETIFTLGIEDGHWNEFTSHEFRDVREFTCRVGVDCSAETLPNTLCRDRATAYPDEQVKRLTIMFQLDQDYGELLLRLARGGTETTVVAVDGQQTHLVTNTMLGSKDGWQVGTHNLMLGALKEGTHTIELSVAEDGKGDGCFSWDVLALVER